MKDTHKQIERQRYDRKAEPFLERNATPELGAAGVPVELRPPYEEFERRIGALVKPRDVVLDIGAGMGAFSTSARGEGRFLIAADISPVSLRVARQRAAEAGVTVCAVCADAERLPFRDRSVDLVTAAGALYCLDLDAVSREMRRVLRPDGAWVIVDSLDDSPVYRLNRFIGYMRHRRTALALRNMPRWSAIEGLREGFGNVVIAYHGVLAFLLPILKPLLGAARAGDVVRAADRGLRWLRRWAFKVVVVAQHPR